MAKKHIGKRFDPELVERFDKMCEEFPTPDACLTTMLACTEESAFTPAKPSQTVASVEDILTLVQCTDEEKEMVQHALAESVIPWKRLLRTAIVAEARSRTTYAKKFDDLDLSDAKARQHVRGAGFVRCREVLDDVMAANRDATSLSGRYYITPSFFKKYGGVSPGMAIRFCETCAAEIAEHNRAMGFQDARQGKIHNQYVYKGSMKNRESDDDEGSETDRESNDDEK
jgi:hypothetical protein